MRPPAPYVLFRLALYIEGLPRDRSDLSRLRFIQNMHENY